MTTVEKQLYENERKKVRLANLADKHIVRLNENLKEEAENHYYADSWEQSAQISRRMDDIRGKIEFLSKLKRKLVCGVKVTLVECTRFKRICISYGKY